MKTAVSKIQRGVQAWHSFYLILHLYLGRIAKISPDVIGLFVGSFRDAISEIRVFSKFGRHNLRLAVNEYGREKFLIV